MDRPAVYRLLSSPHVTIASGGPKTRALYGGRVGDYAVGKVVCLKGDRRYSRAHEETFEMDSHDLPPKNQLAAANHFVVHTRTGCGLYAQHAGSTGTSDFGLMLRRVAVHASRNARNQAEKAAGGRKATPAAVKQIQERFLVDWTLLVRRENLATLVREWKSMASFQYKVATASPSATTCGPLAEYTKLEARGPGRPANRRAGIRPAAPPRPRGPGPTPTGTRPAGGRGWRPGEGPGTTGPR